jgi:hypothetical protein
VLVAGGYDGICFVSSAELYDSNREVDDDGQPERGAPVHTATLLPSGKVLVAGGYNFSKYSAMELMISCGRGR